MNLNSWNETISENDSFKEVKQLSGTRTVKTAFFLPYFSTYYWFIESITTESFSYVGMTEAAAALCVTAMVAAYTKNVTTATVDITTGAISSTVANLCVADVRAYHMEGLMWRVDVDINEVATSFANVFSSE